MITFLIICGMISLLSAYMFSRLIVYSNRQPIVKNPADYGMKYEDVEFKSIDAVRLKGWLIPGKSDKLIIQSHPFPFNRAGFLARYQGLLKLFRTNVDLLATTKALNDKGYSVLTFDFRNHGESGKDITGIGLNEYQDIVGAVNYVKSRKDLNTKSIGLVSFCMGANSSIIALSKAKNEMRDIKCLVAIQPVSADIFIKSYTAKTFTQLGLFIIPFVNRGIQLMGGAPLKKMSPLSYVKDMEIPVLYIQTVTDPWTNLSDIISLYERTQSKKELFFIKEVMGRFETYNWVGRHPETIIDFLKKHCI